MLARSMNLLVVVAMLLLRSYVGRRVRSVNSAEVSGSQARPTVVAHEAGRRLGDAEYRQQELIERMQAEDYESRMMKEFYDRQREERDNPYVDPPQGKPWASKDGLSINWFTPSYRWGERVYYLAQIRECERDGLKAFFGWCGSWLDLYKTPETSCDISGFTRNGQINPDTRYQVRVRSCLDTEDLEECKNADRKWSQLSEKFQPARPKPLEPSAEEKLAAQQREKELQAARQAREQREIQRQQLFDQNRREQEAKRRAEWDKRKDEAERIKWRAKREQERQEEKKYAAEQGNIIASDAIGGHRDNLLEMLESVRTRAESQEVSAIGNKILVQTYIEGGRSIIKESARIGANPNWLVRFENTLTSRFELYGTDMSIRMLRNAFRLATDEARKDHLRHEMLRRQKQAEVAEAKARAQAQARAEAKAVARTQQNTIQQQHVPTGDLFQEDLSLGDIVVLSDNYEYQPLCRDAPDGPLKKGKRGKVVDIIDGEKPYVVEAIEGTASGQRWGYTRYAVRKSRRKASRK